MYRRNYVVRFRRQEATKLAPRCSTLLLPFGIAPTGSSGGGFEVSSAGMAVLSSDAVQSPAQSFVPLTVPTRLGRLVPYLEEQLREPE
jgi:hypothetical protein